MTVLPPMFTSRITCSRPWRNHAVLGGPDSPEALSIVTSAPALSGELDGLAATVEEQVGLNLHASPPGFALQMQATR
jgi:hypothetical protein